MKRTLAIVLSMLLVLPCIASFTVFADVWAGEKIRVDGINNGVWQNEAVRTEYYDVNYAIDDENLYIEVDYYGTLNGTASSYGNGNGTMIRIWFHDEDAVIGEAKARSYTNFIDISYVDGAVWDRFLVNTNATGNTATVVYSYNDGAARPYTINSNFGENTWVMKLTMPLSAVSSEGNVQFQTTVSNKDADTENNALYFGKTNLIKGANGLGWYWDRGSALPAPEGTVAYFTETDVPDVGTHKNIAVGSDEYGTPIVDNGYTGKMADGIVPDAGYINTWRAFRGDYADNSNTTNGYQFVIVDLGAVRDDIGSVGTWFWSANQAGIDVPYELDFFGSIDGSSWLHLGAADLSDELHQTVNSTAVWEYVTFDTTLAARYIMMRVYAGYSFSFFGEISVNIVEAPQFDILSSVGFAAGDITILVPYTDANGTYNTPMEISTQIGPNAGTGKDYNYYSLIVVGADGKVVSVHKDFPDTTHGNVEIPEGGYALGMNGSHADISNWNNAIFVGDTITLNGIDIADYAGVAATSIEGASFASNHTHAFEEKIVEPTCAKEGYTALSCSCGSEKVDPDSVVPATGKHAYTGVLQDNGTYKYTCSTCDDVYYGDAAGTPIISLAVSHNNLYNWGTYESMIITGDGKTVGQVMLESHGTAYEPLWWIMYVVENINGKYVATKYYKNVAEVNTTVVPEGGFLWYVFSANSAYAAADNGALLNHYFAESVDGLFFTKASSATTIGYILASPVPEADYTEYDAAVANANALNEKDYTPETWATLAAALAVDVSGKLEYDQSVVDAATAAINNALLALEDAEVSVLVGDVNEDGEITSLDIVALAKLIAESGSGDAADVNEDGEITSLDIVALAKVIANA